MQFLGPTLAYRLIVICLVCTVAKQHKTKLAQFLARLFGFAGTFLEGLNKKALFDVQSSKNINYQY